jgi:hypothetical protein
VGRGEVRIVIAHAILRAFFKVVPLEGFNPGIPTPVSAPPPPQVREKGRGRAVSNSLFYLIVDQQALIRMHPPPLPFLIHPS